MTEAAAKSAPPAIWRWGALVIVSLGMAGNYYIYDSINPLEELFKTQLGFDARMFGWLNSSYSVAAVLTLLLGGYVIDRVGLKQATALFSALCFLGAVLMAAKGSFAVMVAGRAVLGLGAESMIVAVTTALAKWFKGRELSFAFGLNLTIARLASVAADRSRSWAGFAFRPEGPGGPEGWRGPLLVAVGAGALCLVAAVLYWLYESAVERRFTLGEAGAIDRLELGRGLRLGRAYWFVVGLCFTFYSAIFPFRTFAIKFFTSRLLIPDGGSAASEALRLAAQEQAGYFNSLLPLAAMIATPLFGLLADRFGKRALLMTMGSFLLMPVYLIMAHTQLSLYIPVTMMGVAFSLIPAVMWPSVAYLVDQRRLGTAYAIMTLIQQIGFFALNLLIGWANDLTGAGIDNPGGYSLGMSLFTTLSLLGLMFAFLLRRTETGPHAHGLETAAIGRA
jgi:MFS family permease